MPFYQQRTYGQEETKSRFVHGLSTEYIQIIRQNKRINIANIECRFVSISQEGNIFSTNRKRSKLELHVDVSSILPVR